MPKITIDDKEIEFKEGQTIIQAATEHGIDVPHYCWHPKLSVSGNCRMCLVEIEKMPKLAIACSTIASDGMKVFINSERAVNARKAVMEFLLINHPLDCPICDEAGECKLQDYAFDHSTGESRFKEEKQHKAKRVPLGPYVMFDGERCISCSRCIRFCDEIVKKPQLTFVKRGDRVTIETYPGKELDNDYSLNVTDICPVGALTNRDFRFKARVWEMSSTKTICNGCSRGCNIEMWVRNNEILRLTPRYNEEVNSYWMCDHGRVNTFKSVNDLNSRIQGAYFKKENDLKPISLDEAYETFADVFEKYKASEIALFGSAFSTCEDNYILRKIASPKGIENIVFRKYTDTAFGDDLLKQNDVTPNATGAQAVGISGDDAIFDNIISAIESGKIKAAIVLDDDLAKDKSIEAELSKLEFLMVLASNFNATTSIANLVVGIATYAEKNGTLVNFEGRVQRIRPAVPLKVADRALDGYTLSRWDKFGTEFDRWAKKNQKDAVPAWLFLVNAARQMNIKLNYQMAEDVFEDIAKNVKQFNGLDYDVLGDHGSILKSITETKLS